MSDQNRQTVLRFIEAMGQGDREAAIPCLSPNATTMAKGYSQFAGVRTYDTIVGTIGAFKDLIPTGLRPIIHRVIGEGDTIVVEWEGNGVTYTGIPYRNQYCMIFTLKDGLITRVDEYFCTLHADTVLWPLVKDLSPSQPR